MQLNKKRYYCAVEHYGFKILVNQSCFQLSENVQIYAVELTITASTGKP